MVNPYISIFSTQDLPSKTRELASLWEKFVSKSLEDGRIEKIRKNVFESWVRCQETGVNPRQMQTNAILTEHELKQLWKESELYQIAKPIIDDFFQKMSGTGYLITLSNKDGYIIYLKGEPQVLREAEKMNFAPGMDWSESSAGTNAIGTSIVTRSPIQIFSAEHFCEGCHPWTCSSAPITHPFTKETIGALDFTGFWGNAQPHTLGLAVSLAQVIENQLAHIYMRVNHYLTESYFQGVAKWKNEHVLVLNHAFFAVKGSHKLEEELKLSPGTSLRSSPSFLNIIAELTNIAPCSDPIIPTTEVNIGNYQLIKMKQIHYLGTIAGYKMVLKEKKRSLSTLPSPNHKKGPWPDVIGNSEGFLSAVNKCYKAAPSNVPILLLGESGTGKEKIAQSIHKSSQRSDKPFLAINCGAIQKELIGSELFGYEKGAFTGALKDGKKGKFEEANGGTLFLDEIGEMPLELQVHLLRVLQEKEITRIGSSQPISVNVRIIAATHKNLFDLCKQGLFREDLLFRLNVVSVNIPPLRERKDDILLVADFFLKSYIEKYEKADITISDETLRFFAMYSWPGNIRELQNVLEHAVLFCETSTIGMTDLPSYLQDDLTSRSNVIPKLGLSFIDTEERKMLITLLEETNWNLSAVAKKMNIARSTLYRKLKKYKLSQPKFKETIT
ncbi:sigma-54-dependent Fis family transcriptional regulator [Neobacillus sp. LXY-4]|uniref:sigma-54-dependent Fis family transcriptional regulator n=1 Tax=Neobacillus sp. LXY-4 TaxID=3379826 RepID=UPI003EE316B1